MYNSKQIQTTPNADDRNKFTFKGKKYIYLNYFNIISGCHRGHKRWKNEYNKAFNGGRFYPMSSDYRSRFHLFRKSSKR